ncbi:MAG: hypothetical protein DSY70_02905 [Desulfobulbus sp.]|nr:MAG: hypothetical protein DSY70_02905 [Desulfobulbus sp.]
MADDVRIPRVFFVGNQIEDEEDRTFLIDALGEPPVAFFPNSSTIRKAERSATPVTAIADTLENAPAELLKAVLEES